jgi:hypothetical protein
VDDLQRADGADYLIAGTVWSTVSKPVGHPVLGTAGLARLVRAARVPVLAIGGVEVEGAPEIAETGAAGIAAVGLFIDRHVEGEVSVGAGGARTGACRAYELGPVVRTLRDRFMNGRQGDSRR